MFSRQHPRAIASLLAIFLLTATAAAYADGKGRTFRMVVTPEAGKPLFVVPGAVPTAGGFSSTLITLAKKRQTGSFTTDIISDEFPQGIFDVLGTVLSGMPVTVGAVRGVFETDFGTIVDEHQPTVIALDEPPTIFSNGIVMIATADGRITGGTRVFRNASGTSTLYIKFEVGFGPEGQQAVVRSGTFMFEFE